MLKKCVCLSVFCQAIKGRLKLFFNDSAGNTVIVFTIAIFALLAAIGGAVDFSRVGSTRHEMQDAVDAALLRTAALKNLTDGQLTTEANKIFAINFDNKYASDISGSVQTTTVGNTLSESYIVSAKVETIFGDFIGLKYVPLIVSAKAQSSMHKSEIAFVLDVTGSMANVNKMTNLKSSVDSVLAGLLTNGTNVSDTKVSIVPFNTQVKIGSGTGLNYVSYGGATTVSESCKNGTDGWFCNVLKDTYDKVCMASSDVLGCKSTALAYAQSYSQTSDGVSRTFYNVTVVAKDSAGNVFKLVEISHTRSQSVAQTPVVSINPETGATMTTPSSIIVTTHYLDSQVASNGKDSSVYDNISLLTNTCANPGQSSTCYKSVPAGTIVYNYGYANGYGAAGAVSKSTTSIFGSAAGNMWLNLPSVTDQSAKWLGCVYDRAQPYDTTADPANSSNPATLYPARECDTSTLSQVQPLSTDIQAARSFVQNLIPGGNTNITVGVQWGMEVLSPDAPMTGGVSFSDTSATKYMIIVTDGDNTASRYSTSQSAIDARTTLACSNAKSKGITVFTVKVIEGNSSMLRACASRSDYFYDLTNATQLNTALSSIFESIKKLRLTQ